MLGERELDASRQLWSRSVMRLLGRSLGIPYNEVLRNHPAPVGRVQVDCDSPLTPLPPDQFTSWSDHSRTSREADLDWSSTGPRLGRGTEPRLPRPAP